MVLETLKDLEFPEGTKADEVLEKIANHSLNMPVVSVDDLRRLVREWIEQAQEKLKKEKDQEAIWFAKGAIEVLKRLHNLE